MLVIYGEYDWIMSRDDHRQIVDIVNQLHPGLAKYIEIPKMGHNITLHTSAQEAFTGANPKYASEVFKIIMNWLKNTQNM